MSHILRIPADLLAPIEKIEVETKAPKKTEFEWCKEMLGGAHIAVVALDSTRADAMVVDEDGEMKGLPFNFRATLIKHKSLLGNIVGDAFVVSRHLKTPTIFNVAKLELLVREYGVAYTHEDVG